ncbi:hypothetical protein [Aquihabitans sp. McL0605]|uniref:hypothetical protein n=1 Tax=Aquihabitans sp. McL0605 TaxID=3415671 RepID=UPI003CF73191
MHPRRVPTFIGLGLVVLGLVVVLLPYRAHVTVTVGFDATAYSMQCQAPLIDRVTSDPPQVWHLSGSGAVAEGFATSPSPCHSERGVRGLAGVALMATGGAVWVVARRRNLARDAEAAVAPVPVSSAQP